MGDGLVVLFLLFGVPVLLGYAAIRQMMAERFVIGALLFVAAGIWVWGVYNLMQVHG